VVAAASPSAPQELRAATQHGRERQSEQAPTVTTVIVHICALTARALPPSRHKIVGELEAPAGVKGAHRQKKEVM
jgi:hypothetical protein